MTDINPPLRPTKDNHDSFTGRSDTMPGDESKNYEIRIKGHIEEYWSEWLGDLYISREEQGNSLLAGRVADQAALHGILTQIRDMGLTLISLNQISDGDEG
jgi:hypothetical protein